jgi:hypothetical protein
MSLPAGWRRVGRVASLPDICQTNFQYLRRKKMFKHQQMATTMMPDFYCVYTCGYYSCGNSCHICSFTCFDGTWGGGGGGGCGPFSPVEVQAQVQDPDPARALEELRKRLELQLAAVQAQERLLQERKSATK